MAFGSIIDRFMGFFGYMRADKDARQASAAVRQTVYLVNEKFYDNTIYEPYAVGGMCEWVTKHYFGIDKLVHGMAGYFNPVKEVVEAYQNVLPGLWNQTIKPQSIQDGADLDPKFIAGLTQIWRDSNLDTEKQMLVRWAANLGTVGLRVVRYPSTVAGKQDRVAIRIDNPGRIFDAEEDSAGNVTSICLKYHVLQNVGSLLQPAYERKEVIEEITRDSFSQTIDGVQQIDDADRTNPFGFCPYVILRHKDNGTIFGDWAYKGQERIIHRINYRIARQDVSVDRNLFPKWFASAGGRAPTQIDLGGEKMSYVQTVPGTPPPSIEAIVAKLQHGDVMAFWQEVREMMGGPLPELRINDVKLFSHISGDTLDRVLAPAKAAIEAARPNYDHAITRAMQMALSMAADLGTINSGFGVGAGSGTRAYESGALAFQFADRPSLPQTMTDKLNQVKLDDAPKLSKLAVAKAAQGIGADDQTVLEEAGYSNEDAKAMLKERATTGVVPPPGSP